MSNQFRKLLGLGAVLLFSASSLMAQSAEEILKKHNDAVGGADAWKKVNSLRMSGKMSMMGMEMPITVSKLRNAGVRKDFEVMGSKCYIIVSPSQAWMFIPPQGMSTAQEIPADQFQAIASEGFFGDLVMEMGNNGYTFETAGISTLDGKPVVPGKGTPESDQYYRLKALDPKGNATDLYLDMKTYYLVKTSRMVKGEGQEAELALTYTDYKKEGGIVMPMTIKSEAQGDQKFEKLEVDPAIEAGIFKP